MPHWTYTFSEFMTFLCFVSCVLHARNSGSGAATRALKYNRLAMGILTGGAIEVAMVSLRDGYEYGPFNLMIFHVPMVVMFGWGVILYSAMATTDAMRLRWSRPIVDVLLALSLDFLLDPVAEVLGFWTWNDQMHTGPKYFDIPYDNYLGWFMIVAAFTTGSRFAFSIVGGKKGSIIWHILAGFATMAFTVMVVAVAQLARSYLFPTTGTLVPFMVLYGAAILIGAIQFAFVPRTGKLDLRIIAVPGLIIGYLTLFFLTEGIYSKLPSMVVVWPLVIAVSAVGYMWHGLSSVTNAISASSLREIFKLKAP